jgi:hypothetical protein
MEERRVLMAAVLRGQRCEPARLPRGGPVSQRATRRGRRLAILTPVARRAAKSAPPSVPSLGQAANLYRLTCRSNNPLYSLQPR